ncbi:MAG: thrombospondin type-1 domain-containing protein, partial [Flavobacteriales bacterium]
MKKLLIPLLLLFTTVANAAYFNLADAPYNLTQADYSVKVSDRYTTGKDTIALPYAWAAFKGKEWGLTYAQFRSLWYFSAAYTDAAWHGEVSANTARGYLNEFNFVDIPNGRFQSNVSLTIPRAGMRGTGTFGYYLGSNAYTTEIVMDDARWIDTDRHWHERVLFSTPQWNDDSFYSYNESYNVSLLHLSGPEKNDGIVRIGIAFGRSGEASKWDLLKSDYFSYGIVARQGVPMSGGTCSVFGNSIAGFAGIGCALASMDIDVISGDRNNALAMLIPGYGAAGGGNLNMGLAKAEDANPQGGGKYGSQVVGWFEGQFHVTIANVRYSCDTRINDALFVVNPVIADHLDWGTQGSYLRATGQGFNYNTLLHNVSTSTRVAAGADYKSWSFEWFADGNRFITNGPGDFAWRPAGTKALASLDRNPNTGAPIGVWNYAAGTPARTGGVAPPIPCTWTAGPWSEWSTCVNSQQSRTRTVTSTGDCTGAIRPPTVEDQACTVTPPPCTITYTVT